MKGSLIFATILLVLFSFFIVNDTNAQISSQKITTSTEGYQFTIQGNLDTISTATTNYDSLWTKELGLGGFDENETFTYVTKFTPTAGNPKYSIEVFGSVDNITYFKADTLIYQSTNNARNWGNYKIQNNSTQKLRFPYMKFLILGILAGRDNAAFRFDFYSPVCDPAFKPKNTVY